MATSLIATYNNINSLLGGSVLSSAIYTDWGSPNEFLGVPFSLFSGPYYNKNMDASIYMLFEDYDINDNSYHGFLFTTGAPTENLSSNLVNINDVSALSDRITNSIATIISADDTSCLVSMTANYYTILSGGTLTLNRCSSSGTSSTVSVTPNFTSNKTFSTNVTNTSGYYWGTATSATIFNTLTSNYNDYEMYGVSNGSTTSTNHWHYPTHVDVSFYGSAAYTGTLYWKTDRFNTEPITLTYSLAYVTSSGGVGCSASSQTTISASSSASSGSISISNASARYWGTKSSSTNMFCLCSISTSDASVALSSSTGSCVADCSYTESTSYSVSYSIDTMTTAIGVRNTITHSASSPFAVTYNISTRYNYLTESGNLGIDTVSGTVTVSANATSGYTNVETTYMLNAILSVTVTSTSPTTYNGSTVTYTQTGNTF